MMRDPAVQWLNAAPRTVSVRNANASAVFVDGKPVFYDGVGATYLGVDCKLYNEAGVSGILAGIVRCNALTGLAVGEIGEAVAAGFTDAIVVLRTRAATTDTWASAVAIALNDQLIPVTDGLGALSRQGTLAASNQGLNVIAAGDTLASLATAGSASTNMVGTAWTARLKVFVRPM